MSSMMRWRSACVRVEGLVEAIEARRQALGMTGTAAEADHGVDVAKNGVLHRLFQVGYALRGQGRRQAERQLAVERFCAGHARWLGSRRRIKEAT